MTNNEAISKIKFLLDVGGSDGFTSADIEALNMAINALSAEIVTPPKTNGDRIRSMTDEELADFLNTLSYNCCDGKCCDCPVSGYEDVEGDCSVEEWLRKEADEDAGSKTN